MVTDVSDNHPQSVSRANGPVRSLLVRVSQHVSETVNVLFDYESVEVYNLHRGIHEESLASTSRWDTLLNF